MRIARMSALITVPRYGLLPGLAFCVVDSCGLLLRALVRQALPLELVPHLFVFRWHCYQSPLKAPRMASRTISSLNFFPCFMYGCSLTWAISWSMIHSTGMLC